MDVPFTATEWISGDDNPHFFFTAHLPDLFTRPKVPDNLYANNEISVSHSVDRETLGPLMPPDTGAGPDF